MTYTYRPEIGDTVTFTGWIKEQVRWGGNDTPYMLIIDRQYEIDYVERHSSHTKVGVRGVIGRFNSIHFALADKY